MPKLSEIVGGLMRDLARSHVVADAQTRDVFESYKKDPVLTHFPVPRVTITQATMKLKFAIKEHAPPPAGVDPKEYQDLVGKSIRERVVPEFLATIGRLDNKEVTTRYRERVDKAGLHTRIAPETIVSEERLPQLEKDMAALLLEQVRALPKSIQKQMPAGEALEKALQQAVAREAQEVQQAALTLKRATETAQNDIDVSVRAEDLKALGDAQVNELVLTVGLEDVEGDAPE
jgi:hypothetical protein